MNVLRPILQDLIDREDQDGIRRYADLWRELEPSWFEGSRERESGGRSSSGSADEVRAPEWEPV